MGDEIELNATTKAQDTLANPFNDVGFRQVKDVVDLRVFDLLNISRINNNRAEEMLLCIYHLLQPDRRIDEGIYNDEIDQYFSYREWKIHSSDTFLCGGENLSRMKVRHDPPAHPGDNGKQGDERFRAIQKYPLATDKAMKRFRDNDTSLWGWRSTRQR